MFEEKEDACSVFKLFTIGGTDSLRRAVILGQTHTLNRHMTVRTTGFAAGCFEKDPAVRAGLASMAAAGKALSRALEAGVGVAAHRGVHLGQMDLEALTVVVAAVVAEELRRLSQHADQLAACKHGIWEGKATSPCHLHNGPDVAQRRSLGIS